MIGFDKISVIFALLGSTVATAGIDEILSAKDSSSLRRARDQTYLGRINKQICANQRQFKRAPLHCETDVIERQCHGELAKWTISELRQSLKQRGLSARCREKLASDLEVKIYQAADFADQGLGLGLEDSMAHGTRNSSSSDDLRTD